MNPTAIRSLIDEYTNLGRLHLHRLYRTSVTNGSLEPNVEYTQKLFRKLLVDLFPNYGKLGPRSKPD